MNNETQTIIRDLKEVLDGKPWYGRSLYSILEETDPSNPYTKQPLSAHSSLDLLYHLLTWTQFSLERLKYSKQMDAETTEKLDWREIDPKQHTWEKGLNDFKTANDEIIKILGEKNDSFLDEKVDYRSYNFRYMLNGLIQHYIYHSAQIAYINKYLL